MRCGAVRPEPDLVKIRVRGDVVKARVNQDLCISCGLCVSTCPEVFNWNNDEKAEAINDDVPSEHEDCVKDAADGCPTDAIETE